MKEATIKVLKREDNLYDVTNSVNAFWDMKCEKKAIDKTIIELRKLLINNGFFDISIENLVDNISRPVHYGGEENPFEAIKIIEYYDLNFSLGNALKYILRCGKKDEDIKELTKAKTYIEFEIKRLGRESKV